MKFCFHFCYMYCKIIPSQKSVTLTLENNLFASVGCENAQMAQKRTLEWTLRINDGYSTMSDEITSSGGRGLAILLGLLHAMETGINSCAPFNLNLTLSSWRRLFLLNDYNSMPMSFMTKLNFWRRKHYRIRLDSFLYLSWFTAMINATVCWSSLFSADLKRHQYKLEFELFVFGKQQSLLSLFFCGLLTVGYTYYTYDSWFCLFRCCSDSAQSNNFAWSMCVSLKIKTKTSKTASLVLSASKIIKSEATDKSNC